MANVILPNNNTSLYNATGNATPVDGNISANNINATGNVTVGGYITANGSITTNSNFVGNLIGNVTGNVTGNLVLTGGNTEVIYNQSGVTGSSPAFTFDYGSNILTVSGDINTDTVSATGNITADYYFGDGSQLTGLPATYGNANVADYLPTYTGNLAGGNLSIATDISATGNITGNYILGNGALLSGLPATYSNANVQAYLPTYTGNLNPDTISATGNITGLNLKTSGATGNIVGANYVSANFYLGDGGLLSNISSTYGNAQVAAYLTTYTGNITANVISATGNITGSYFIGNGSQLTGLPSGYSNADVNAHLAAFGSNVISTTGNITAANFLGNISGSNVVGAVANATYAASAGNATTANTVTDNAQPNITSVGTLTNLAVTGNITSATVSTTGNITGNYLIGDGSLITNLPGGSYGNANVANYLPTFSGNLSAGNASVTGQVAITTGSNTWRILNQRINSPAGGEWFSDVGNLDEYITSAPNGYIDLQSLYANSAVASLIHLEHGLAHINVNGDQWTFQNGNLTLPGNSSSVNYANGVSILSGLASTYGNANVADFLANAFGSNTIATTGNITAANFLGNIAAANVVGTVGTANTVTGNAQANITSVGTLTSLSVSGNVTAGNVSATGTVYTPQVESATDLDLNTAGKVNVNGNIRVGDNNTDTQIATHGASDLILRTHEGATNQGSIRIYDGANANIDLDADGTGTINLLALVSATGNITAPYFIGNGSQLTGLPAGYSNADVNAHLAAFGSNTISTTGNVTAGYFIGDGSQLTGISANATPGGANTQIQYNANGVFAGNAIMTFNDSTGVVTLGNVAVSNLNINSTTATIDTANVSQFATNVPWRITIGNLYNGVANSIYSGVSAGNVLAAMNGRLLVSDLIYVGNNNTRMQEINSQTWYVATANITNTNNRYSGTRTEVMFGGGASNNFNAAALFGGLASSTQLWIGAGTNANLSVVGNTNSTSQGYVGHFVGSTVNLYSSANSVLGVISQIATNHSNATAYGNATNQIAYYSNFTGSPANANATGTTTAVAFYNPGTTGIFGSVGTNGNIARQATNYYAFRNDDNLAKSKLGMLDSFHELNANTANTTGNITISKADGQVQTIYPTGNITIASFTNFVTRVQKPDATQTNTADTVTLVIQQGATPYTVTMPTGNANIRYAGGVSTVTSTANTTTMISVTGVYNYDTTSTNYLVTISPEFS